MTKPVTPAMTTSGMTGLPTRRWMNQPKGVRR
jgi:hypothetical protein